MGTPRRAGPALGVSAGFLRRLRHSPCFALRGTGIANPARGKVARLLKDGLQRFVI
jgi:hypothetical protein